MYQTGSRELTSIQVTNSIFSSLIALEGEHLTREHLKTFCRSRVLRLVEPRHRFQHVEKGITLFRETVPRHHPLCGGYPDEGEEGGRGGGGEGVEGETRGG